MVKLNSMVFVFILATVIILGCNIQEFQKEDITTAKKPSATLDKSSDDEIAKFNITLNPFKTVEIKNVTLPIDTSDEACEVWRQVLGKWSCNVGEQEDYWAINGEKDCSDVSFAPCGGSCTGKIRKEDGNITDLSCDALA